MISRIKGRSVFFLIPCIIAFTFLITHQVEANVDLLYFRAESGTNSITLQWETASELDNLGFNILRSENDDIASAFIVNPSLIPSLVGGQPIGAYYEWMDEDVELNVTYSYWLQDIDFNGGAEEHGPVNAALTAGNTIPTIPPLNTIPPTAAPTDTPEPSPSATPRATSQATATQISTPRSENTRSPTATAVQIDPTAISVQPTQTDSLDQPPTRALQSATPIFLSSESTESSPATFNEETGSPEAASQQAAELVAETAAKQVTAENTPDSSPDAVGDQSTSQFSPQSIGSVGRETSQSEKSVDEEEGFWASSSILALIILIAALLIAVGGGITVWLLIRPQRLEQDHE